MKSHVCLDCQSAVGTPQESRTVRAAPFPGPRCPSHHRDAEKAVGKAKRLRAHGRRVEAGFSITEEEYWEIYKAQGGRCAAPGCTATGAAKRLAVDHDHRCCPGKTSCGRCVRGLLCGPHNEEVGRNRDNPKHYLGMAYYLMTHPAQGILRRVRARTNQAISA